MLVEQLEKLLVVASSVATLRGESEALNGNAASFSLGQHCAWSSWRYQR